MTNGDPTITQGMRRGWLAKKPLGEAVSEEPSKM